MSAIAIAGGARAALRHWKAAVGIALLATILLLKISLTAEQLHAAKLERRLVETTAAYDRFKAEVAASAERARAEDAAHVRRVERDQVRINQETASAYHDQIALLRARAAERVRGERRAADGSGSRGAAMPGVSDAAGRIDEAAREDGLSRGDELIASEIAVRLNALQNWVKAQTSVDYGR